MVATLSISTQSNEFEMLYRRAILRLKCIGHIRMKCSRHKILLEILIMRFVDLHVVKMHNLRELLINYQLHLFSTMREKPFDCLNAFQLHFLIYCSPTNRCGP